MLRHSTIIAALAAAFVISATQFAPADDWGNLKGRFIYDGKAPDPTKLTIDKDQQICGDKGLVDESLVVDSSGGMANVVLWIRGKAKVHPDYEKSADATVVLDNKGCRFNPHVQGVRVGQTLQIKNSDPVAHNTNIVGRNLQVNPLIPAGSASDQKIEAPENLPANVSCNIHPWMKARVVVRSSPYFAISKKDGSFEIKNLPAGDLEFVVYHERSGFVQDAETKSGKVNWPKGVMKVTIEPGKDTDLGDIKLAAAQFNKD
jgi:plastocyanin